MKLKIAVIQESELWVARCLDFMISQTGSTKQNAIDNLIETLKQMNNKYGLKKVTVNENNYNDWEISIKEVLL